MQLSLIILSRATNNSLAESWAFSIERSPRSLVCTKCKREKYPSSIDTQIFDKSSTMMIISKSVDKYMDVTKERERFSWSLIFTIPIKCLFEEFYTYFAKI